MAKTLRVHTLAKELCVPSKAIIDKCKAEGIEVKNHMSAIAVGLAESIKEWFSTGDDVTTVEVATPVDLDKVKVRAEPISPAMPDDADAHVMDEGEPEEDGAASAVETVAVPEPEADEAEISMPAIAASSATVEDEAVLDTIVEPQAEAPVEPASVKPVAMPPIPPPAPKPIVPAGPQVQPAPAELKGPQIVRVEAPEPERPRAPRSRPAPYSPPGTGGPERFTDSPAAPGRAGRGRGRRPGAETPAARSRSPRRQGRASEYTSERIKEWRDQDVIERRERLASATGHGLRARRSAEKRRKASSGGAPTAPREKVEITAPLLIKDFCSAIGVPFNIVNGKLVEQTSKFYRINDSLDAETAELVAMELGITLEIKHALSALETLQAEFAQRERPNLRPRPPVVAMLGHVDHGKTSLLDAIRQTHVAAGEAGGITQHIGAYRIDRGEWHVTFLDTPGHEAFTSMRARGADLTDVVVLVVAADDGVMPQTVEAINHAKAAKVQIVVALNKIDLPGIDLNRIYAQLSEQGLTPQEWGGETDVVKTSATTGEGIDQLLEHLSTLTELLDLKADPTVPVRGTVIEAQMREGRGVVAQVLVREGTLKAGEIVVCGPAAGRVRSLTNDRGKRIKAAEPGTPVEVLGLDEIPDTGDVLLEMKNLSQAKTIAEKVRGERREAALNAVRKPTTLEDLLRTSDEDEIPELNLILKVDNRGSLEAVTGKLEAFPSDQARLRILHAGVGAISEADVALAQASGAVIIGFHVVADDRARRAAEQSGVQVRTYRVIYEIVSDVKKALEGLLAPELHEEQRAKVEVRQVFNVSRVGTIAGCYVLDGVVHRTHKARLIRDGRIVAEGLALDSLKRFKDDAREVRAGLECGIKLAGYDDVKPADIIEAYEVVEVARKL